MSRRRRKNRGPVPTDQAGLRPGDAFQLTLGGWTEFGECTAEHAGFPVYVSGGIPGEHVSVEVTRAYPESFAANVVEIHSRAADRVPAPCLYYLACSGCQFQHLSYDRQLRFKRERVCDALAECPEISGVRVEPTLPSPLQLGYRNHARFTVSREGELGFINRHTRRFVRVDECLLMSEPINQAITELQDRLQGESQVSVRAGFNTGERMIQPRLGGDGVSIPTGQTHLEERILERRFRVAGSSFFQVNTPQAEAMVRLIADRLKLSGTETVVDAYAGVGTFAISFAPLVARVIAIEESHSAVNDARDNAGDLANVAFVEARTESALAEIQESVDVVILDPPRTGCHPNALEAASGLRPEQVVMVSCDPPSLARDLARLTAHGTLTVESIQPIDMFPQTRHVECLAFLRRREDGS